ncbi:hypothetical protein BaRGS_00035080 [Batillaria attramentaria]|uniref:Uncharacterized protein n=1 Tax=Batillaria attramentaria TaxID=370345 RepID=A0ABD0JFR0_9CAEN
MTCRTILRANKSTGTRLRIRLRFAPNNSDSRQLYTYRSLTEYKINGHTEKLETAFVQRLPFNPQGLDIPKALESNCGHAKAIKSGLESNCWRQKT